VVCAVSYAIYIYFNSGNSNANTSEIKKTIYKYQAKQYFMTKSENDFFHMLNNVAGDRYFIFPQVHLSAILDEKVKNGQNWKAAFKHINGKSVDYVLCDKICLKPTYAVELDDYTHNYSNRQERDAEVERMFQSAGIPLVRFNDYKTLSEEDIAKRFFEAKNTQ
jgi:very-short-patch-repair endonuclease